MQRFILRENLKKFRVRLDAGVADAERAYLLRQIRSIKRELALLNAAALGVQRYPIEFGSFSSRDRSLFHRLTETAVEPTMIIDPRAGMRILDVNDEIGRAHVRTQVTNAQLVCRILIAKKQYYNTKTLIRIIY